MKNARSRVFGCVALVLSCSAARADSVNLGVLSYDTFIPSSAGGPGIDALDLSNLTGVFNLPSDFLVSDNLTFLNAVLTVTPSGQAAEVFDLGDIGPGFLLDTSGNPVVQLASDELVTSAELTATLSSTSFLLSDGTTFVADSTAIDVTLGPSSGQTLTADVDQAVISVSGGAPISSVPEPTGSALLLAAGVALTYRRYRAYSNSR
jgi:hypothetical protein